MTKADRLGEFEEWILLSIRATEAPVYAVSVQRFIAATTGRETVMGAIYAALDRLEDKRLIRSSFGPPTPERGGKRKRLLTVTPEGVSRLDDLRRLRARVWRVIEEKR